MVNTLHDERIKNVHKLIIGNLKINSVRNKFEMLRKILKRKIVSGTKLDNYFPIA